MSDFLPFIVVGLVTGAVYALAAMGLVLTYTTSGVFNFAHGAVGMFATYIFYSLRVNADLPTPLAVAVAVLVVAPLLGVLIDRLLLRRLEGATAATYVVASLGLLVALQGLAVAIYGGNTRQVAGIFPTETYRVPGVNVGIDQTIVVAIAVAAGIALAYFFRRTHLGLQTRAVVGDRDLTELVGTNAGRVTTFSWMLGCRLRRPVRHAVRPVRPARLAAPDPARGAGLRSGHRRSAAEPARTQIGAYAIGVAAAVTTKVVATKPSLAGLPSALPFIVLFVILVFSAARAPSRGHRGRRPTGRTGARAREGPPIGSLVVVGGGRRRPPRLCSTASQLSPPRTPWPWS